MLAKESKQAPEVSHVFGIAEYQLTGKELDSDQSLIIGYKGVIGTVAQAGGKRYYAKADIR